MAKKRRPPEGDRAGLPQGVKPLFPSPFKDLGKVLRQRSARAPLLPAPPAPEARALPSKTQDPADDALLLREAFEGVRRLTDTRPVRLPVEPPVNHSVVSEDAEVLAQLSDLVSGQGAFDITETEHYVEGMRAGLDPRLLVRLRRGEFAMQAHIDLHGMVQSAAKEALGGFVRESVSEGLRAVLVVHGKGLGSPGGHPVLKHATTQWLAHGWLCGYVLAFTTARPADGGTGAVYVLLKRDRRRAPFDVLNGAKRRN